ncbi:MAG TPA: class A beta-lactamase [Bryobacteraceae bacterium]|nr:class A beta-lactamase [Bryobacteraceae bacterium]
MKRLAPLFLFIPLLSAQDRLLNEVSRLAKITDGAVGLTAIHVESSRRADFHSSDRFPMASTFKVPVAVQLLSRVDRGEVRLDQMVVIEPHDLHPGSGTLSNLFKQPGVSLSVRNLMELMLLISDNSATDICLRLAGGPDAVTAKMRELGVAGISVNRSTARLISDWLGAELPPEKEWAPDLFGKLYAAVPADTRKAAEVKFNGDPRDTSQPSAMADLLVMIHNKKLHKPETAELLLDIMRRCQTGDARIKGMLPPNTELAHKTGSIGGTINDVGILALPDNAGHVALALFVKEGTKSEASEKAIAQISRAVYDYFLFAANR